MAIVASPYPPRRSRLRSLGLALVLLLAGSVIGAGSRHTVSADVSSGDRPVFIPIDPCRLADTRPATNNIGDRSTPIGAADTAQFDAHGTNGDCTISTDAAALSLNITALNATAQTFLTIWPDGPLPLAASLNPSPGQPPTPNAVNAPLSASGSFNIYNDAGAVDVVIDVNGYYVPHDHDDRYPLIADVYDKSETYEKGDVYTKSETYAKNDVYTKPETYSKSETYSTGEVNQRLLDLQFDFVREIEASSNPYAPVYGDIVQASRYVDEPLSGGVAAIVTPFGTPMIASVKQTTDTVEIHECVTSGCSATFPDSTPWTAATVDDLMVGRNGDPVVAHRTAAQELRLGFCTQRCATTASVSIAANAGPARITRGSLGPVIVYENLATKQIVLTACSNEACSSVTHTDLASTAGGFGSADIMSTDSGPVVALYTSIDPSVQVITCRLDTCDGIADFAPTRAVLVGGAGVGRDPSIALTGGGNVAVAYRDDATTALALVTCAAVPCANDPLTTDDDPFAQQLTATGDQGLNPTLAYDITGTATITYLNALGERKVIWCERVGYFGSGGIAGCGFPRVSPVATGGPMGVNADLIIGRDGNPILAWTNTGNELYLDYFVGDNTFVAPSNFGAII